MLCTLLGMAAGAYAQCVDKQTYTFAIKGADTLKLDRYVPASRLEGATTPSPLVLFAFGGGFRGGKRDNADYAPYFRLLAQAGYVVVSTDYRTGLKDIGKAGSADLKGLHRPCSRLSPWRWRTFWMQRTISSAIAGNGW